MDFEAIDALRDRHPAWRLLRASNAALVLSFLGQHFVERNQGATSASASQLDDALYALNTDAEQPQFTGTGSGIRADLWPLPMMVSSG